MYFDPLTVKNEIPNAHVLAAAANDAKNRKAPPMKPLSRIASWDGHPFHGRKTASGQIYDMNKLAAAHLTLPLYSQVLVRNPQNGKVVMLKVNDGGPYIKNRVLYISLEAAKRLGILSCGIAYVNYTVLPSQAQIASRDLSDKDTEPYVF